MDIKQQQQKPAMPHSLSLIGRESGTVEGVSKVVASAPDVISLVTSKGELSVRGKDLSIVKYDADSGKLSFIGQIDSIKYEGGKKPLLKRIFK